jgi:hypothetical protein
MIALTMSFSLSWRALSAFSLDTFAWVITSSTSFSSTSMGGALAATEPRRSERDLFAIEVVVADLLLVDFAAKKSAAATAAGDNYVGRHTLSSFPMPAS